MLGKVKSNQRTESRSEERFLKELLRTEQKIKIVKVFIINKNLVIVD